MAAMPEDQPPAGATAVTLWRAVGQSELDAIAAAGWKAWPPGTSGEPFAATLARQSAVRISRERYAAGEGAGFVLCFDVARAFLHRYHPHGTDGEYRIPADALTELNTHLHGAITEDAAYRGPVGESELLEAEAALGRPLPAAWRDYLRGPSWFRAGWLGSGVYVALYPPHEMLEIQRAWGAGTDAHPGVALIGGDGSREHLALDLREDPAPVILVDITSTGWDDGFRQADHVTQLIGRIESGEYEFTYGDG